MSKFYQQQLIIETKCRSTIDITDEIHNTIRKLDVSQGLCNIFLMHTSASLIFCENADPVVRQDLERFMSRLVPDGDSLFKHTAEGEDDMPSHIRTILTQNSLTVPISEGRLALGTWQGVYLWEHRTGSYNRKIIITFLVP